VADDQLATERRLDDRWRDLLPHVCLVLLREVVPADEVVQREARRRGPSRDFRDALRGAVDVPGVSKLLSRLDLLVREVAFVDEEVDSADVRPVVRTADAGNLGLWIFGAIVLIGGLALFLALNARRQDLAAAGSLPAGQGGGMIAAPPPLS